MPCSANGSGSGSGSGGGDVRSPSLSSDEQSSEASLITETGGGGGGGTPLPPDTPDNLTLCVLDSVAGRRHAHCTGRTGSFLVVSHGPTWPSEEVGSPRSRNKIKRPPCEAGPV